MVFYVAISLLRQTKILKKGTEREKKEKTGNIANQQLPFTSFTIQPDSFDFQKPLE